MNRGCQSLPLPLSEHTWCARTLGDGRSHCNVDCDGARGRVLGVGTGTRLKPTRLFAHFPTHHAYSRIFFPSSFFLLGNWTKLTRDALCSSHSQTHCCASGSQQSTCWDMVYKCPERLHTRTFVAFETMLRMQWVTTASSGNYGRVRGERRKRERQNGEGELCQRA